MDNLEEKTKQNSGLSREKKYSILLKDTAIFAIGSLGSKVILFFLVPLYTNYLTSAEYGIADLVTTFSQLLIPLSSLAISNAVIRFGMMKSEKPENVLKSAFVVLGFSVLLVTAMIPVIGLYGPIHEWRYYLVLQVIITNAAEIERTYLKVKNRNKTFSLISIGETLVLACTNILLLVVKDLGVRGYLIANLAAAFFCVAAAFIAGNIFSDLRKGDVKGSLIKRMITYSAPLILSNISWWVFHSSDKIMIEWMITSSALGIYTAATKIPSLINVITAIFNQAWGISSIREIESTSEGSFFRSVFRLYCTFNFGACVSINTFIKPLMNVYVGSEFREAWMYAPLLLSAAVFYSVTAFLGSIYAAIQKTKNDMWTTVMSAIINIIVNYFGIKYLGVWGAVIGTLTAYIVCSAVRLADLNRLIKFSIEPSYLINSCVLLIQSACISLGVNPLPVSAAAIIAFAAINRKEIFLIAGKVLLLLKKRSGGV